MNSVHNYIQLWQKARTEGCFSFFQTSSEFLDFKEKGLFSVHIFNQPLFFLQFMLENFSHLKQK